MKNTERLKASQASKNLSFQCFVRDSDVEFLKYLDTSEQAIDHGVNKYARPFIQHEPYNKNIM